MRARLLIYAVLNLLYKCIRIYIIVMHIKLSEIFIKNFFEVNYNF